MDSDEQKFSAEYAKSDRSSCKLCKGYIGQASLRLAIYVQSPFFDGKMAQWYHFACFFKKATPRDIAFIKGFDSLRWDDQQKIKQKMGLEVTKLDDSVTESEAGEGSAADLELFSVEYAKSSRSKCRKCDTRIEKDKIRVSKRESEKKSTEMWYHLDCFAKSKAELGFNFKPSEILGFESLSVEDQVECVKAIGEPIKKEPATLKRKATEVKQEPEDENDPPEVKKAKQEEREKIEREKQLKAQSVEFWKLRDKLDEELPNEVLKALLEDNDQHFVKTGRDDLLKFLCDAMCYGALEKCSECKNGQLFYSGSCYYCNGNVTEWTKCSFRTQDPKRREFMISKELRDEYSCLKTYKYKPQKRIFATPMSNADLLVKKEGSVAVATKTALPLDRLNFSCAGKLEKKNPEIKLLIERLGGKFSVTMDSVTVAIISNSKELDKMGAKLKQAELSDVPVIDEAFLQEIAGFVNQGFDAEKLISKHKISQWGSDLKARMEASQKAHERIILNNDSKFQLKSSGADNKIKMKLKGGAAVDPDSGLEDEAHVLCEAKTNEPYSCVLGLVDIVRGTNSYYKLQLLEHDKRSTVYMFRAWGRVGTTVGGNKLERFDRKDDAIAEFKYLYTDKTGNEWDERKTSTKKANKFYPLEIDYGDDDKENVNSKLSDKDYVSTSKLHTRIQEIIRLIFDIETMKRQMVEFEIDLNKMPLGKISSNQIKLAFSTLNELNEHIKNGGNHTQFVDASNRFYTLIPHDFGMKKPPILNDAALIKEKVDMLNSLLDIEIAYNILKTGSDDKEDPIDSHYNKLHCNMEILDHESEEFKRLVQYAVNTHAATHSSYTLEIEDILKINREGEDDRFEKFKSLHNRKLLWHGSRLTNFAGILSQGLRIAPPEAPSTGYMFGKGVYFADMVSKSANYCFTNKQNPTALMLLCEVALGDMYERTHAEYVTKLPSGKHSTKGCGTTAPDEKSSVKLEDGTEIPLGKGKDSGVRGSSLLYNEYIVYDVSQVRMKYLLKVKFNHMY